ncbi:hypothetical protein LTR72_012233 [Exophiala xenobiotica]|nr:hypothetical protein LTR72_012233 [Exophiala xenobiotica]
MNPAEYLLDAVNSDFGSDPSSEHGGASGSVQDAWESSEENRALAQRCSPASTSEPTTSAAEHITSSNPNVPRTSWILLHRNFIKSYRDIIAYGTRVVMYLGLAILMGTVWFRLSYDQASIQPFISAIFFGGAFMSFMAVAYVPSIIEDIQNFRKERANGLYGPLPFTIANALVSIPWLFLIAVLFSVIVYWLGNFRATAGAFWMWVLWLFLDLLAAEGLVVLVSSTFPVFVVSLAITAFLNGLWMSVGGFLVPLGTLNVFWKYVFHYIDYQAYVFFGMMANQFRSTMYDCAKVASGYQCMYPGDSVSEGKIQGTAVLRAYNISWSDGEIGKWLGIMVAIIFTYRILGYVALAIR